MTAYVGIGCSNPVKHGEFVKVKQQFLSPCEWLNLDYIQ